LAKSEIRASLRRSNDVRGDLPPEWSGEGGKETGERWLRQGDDDEGWGDDDAATEKMNSDFFSKNGKFVEIYRFQGWEFCGR